MKRHWHGFTLIEVAIFLAVTGALFIAVTVGVQNSIFQQRYNDSVQSFVEFLRTIYSETMNVQSANKGNSDQAIYGKLVVFGQSEDLAGNAINDGEGKNEVFAYDVVGNAEADMGTGGITELLKNIGATIVVVDDSSDEDAKVVPAGIVDTYTPKWASEIQSKCKSEHNCDGSYEPYKGSLLVIRHPRSGTVYTFVSDEALEVNKAVKDANNAYIGLSEISVALAKANVLGVDGVLDTFRSDAADFCINPNGHEESGLRTDIRIPAGARNSSAINILAGSRSEGNMCVKE